MESPPSGEAGQEIGQPKADPSALARLLRPCCIAGNTTKRGDIWRRILKMRQARQDSEKAEVLNMICQAKRLLNRKDEIEKVMTTMQQISALRNLTSMVPLEGGQSRDATKRSFSRKKRTRFERLAQMAPRSLVEGRGFVSG